MKKPIILIVEDELMIAEMIKDMLLECNYEVAGIARNYDDALYHLSTNKDINLAILDINLSGLKNGIDLGEKIGKEFKKSFVFLTSYSDPQTIEKAAATNPSAYLVKPFTKSDLFATIELIKARKPSNSYISLKDRNTNVKFLMDDLKYVKSDNNYLEVYVKDKKIVIRNSLDKFLKEINNPNILRVHRSYAVNIHHVSALNGKYLMIQKEKFPVSRNYRDSIVNVFKKEK